MAGDAYGAHYGRSLQESEIAHDKDKQGGMQGITGVGEREKERGASVCE